MRKLAAGNWKMNGLKADGVALAGEIAQRAKAEKLGCDILICPPAPLLFPVGAVLAGSPVALGAQNCHANEKGAHTGEVAAPMLTDAGCSYVILGHSERRQYQKESDELIAKKALAAHLASLKPIICVGELLAEREAGLMEQVLETQVRGSLAGLSKEQMEETILAYEPVWAIGTGRTATAAQAQEAHAFIRGLLVKMFDENVARRVRIQYGGSVKGANARELMSQPDVDGALVGGAALEARSFADIIKNSI